MDEDDVVFILKRRRSISPSKLLRIILHTSPESSSASDSTSNLDLISLKSSTTTASYTSLKDLLPSSCSTSILSPTPATSTISAVSTASSAADIAIPIRNRLVKQAAWAYLQPIASSYADSPSSRCICFPGDFLRRMFAGFRKFVVDSATRVGDWFVDVFWLICCR